LRCRRRWRGPQVRQELERRNGSIARSAPCRALAPLPLRGACARRLAAAAYYRCMEEVRIGRRQPDGSAHHRYPGFADLDRVLEPVDFAAQSSVEGRAWIAALPELLDRLCRNWRLHVEDGVAGRGYHGVVVLVRRGAERCVLKLTWPAERTVAEAGALTAWRGRGAVLLLEADLEAGALLLERLDPTRTLDSMDLHAAAQVAGRLLRRLAIPAPDGVRPLRAVADEIGGSLQVRQERLGRPVPEGWLATASDLAQELGASAGDRLVHADLHYGNVLAGDREPWLAIDPKPVAGDPEHAIPELLWTRVDELQDAATIRCLLTVLAGSGELDGERARGWAIVRCVDYWLWGLEHGLTEDPKRCRRILGWRPRSGGKVGRA
jgi:streptomycin 6-kinase